LFIRELKITNKNKKMQKDLEEQIKHLKNIIKLNEEQALNQKSLIDQLKQVLFILNPF